MNDPAAVDWLSLVQRATCGDEAAFSLIYQNTVKEVYRTVYLLVQSSNDADELVQEVYVALWKSLRGYDMTRPFLPWLHGLIIRQVRAAKRSCWRSWRILHREMELRRLDAVVQPPDSASAVLLHIDLLTAVEALPLRLREVIVLRYFHGYALTEIGEILRIPAGTARSRHHEALRRLRVDYEGMEGGAQQPCLPSEI